MGTKILHISVFLLGLVVMLSSCGTTGPEALTKQATGQKGASVQIPEADSVVWENLNLPFEVPKPGDRDREWPGERMGLVGPIIAEGGLGSNAYFVVYDATGALVGGIMKREAKELPEYLLTLLMAAHDRSQITMVKGGEQTEGRGEK